MSSSAPATSNANAYSQAVAAARIQNALEREAERAAAVVKEAAAGSFDSLRPARKGNAVHERAARALAESALRRLKRWTDPHTGGLDVGDRDGLLRQAEVMGIPPGAAEQVLQGVEAAWRARPPEVATASEAASSSPSWFRRFRPRTVRIALALGLIVAALVVLQIRLLHVWGHLLGNG